MDAVQIEYELGLSLDQMPAATPFATGIDLIRLLSIFGTLEQSNDAKPRKVDWRLKEASGRGATLRSISEPDVANRAGLSLVQGLDAAEHEPELPLAWSLEAGKRASQVAARLGDTQDTGLRIAVFGERTAEAEVTRQTSRHLKAATDLRFKTYGSVVGVLGVVTAYKSRRASLWSDVTNRRVEVRFQEHHTEDMRNAWARAHVEITGYVHENAAGQVLRVDMDALQVLDTSRVSLAEGLPQGFYPEMTGGLSTHDYLGVIRGE